MTTVVATSVKPCAAGVYFAWCRVSVPHRTVSAVAVPAARSDGRSGRLGTPDRRHRGPEAAAVARPAVAGAGVRELETRIDDVQLAISEVVTNAVRHGRLREGVDAVRVIVGVDGNSIRVTVEQPTTAAGVQIKEPRLEQDDPGGLGMRIVDHVS